MVRRYSRWFKKSDMYMDNGMVSARSVHVGAFWLSTHVRLQIKEGRPLGVGSVAHINAYIRGRPVGPHRDVGHVPRVGPGTIDGNRYCVRWAYQPVRYPTLIWGGA